MKNKILLIVALLCSTALFSQSTDEIINHHFDAIGGKKKWDEIKSIKLVGNIEVGPNMKAPFSMFIKDKNKFRFELEIQGMKMITGLDKDSGWKIVPFTGKMDPERMSPEEVKDAQDQADFAGELYNYKEKGSTVELIDKEDMEGTEVFKLKVTKKDGDLTYIFLDASNYLTLKETTKIKMADKEVESNTIPSNYKEVSGIKFPFSMEVRGDDATAQGQMMTIEKVEINPAIDDAIFKMPPMKSAVDTPPATDKK